MKAIKLLTCLLLTGFSCQAFAVSAPSQAVLQQLKLPPGFHISIFADKLPTARSLALGDNGVIYLGSRNGQVYALQDQDGDGYAEQRHLLADHLNMPNGVAYQDGALYVVEVQRIIRFDAISTQLAHPPEPVVVYDKFPSDKHHGWKYLRFGPDGKLYTAVGVPCNICNPENPIFGSLLRMNADGSHLEILARGIRNSVGFDWQPKTHQLFFHDNGRDYLGDNLPPEELNHWTETGQHFGYPYCHAGSISDPEFGVQKHCTDYTAPVWKYTAHIAPLGMRFYTGSQFPEIYRNQLLVAQHGSWNRSDPQGYQVALVRFKNSLPYAEQVFISGWLKPDGEVLGRPVDILQLPDGSVLISDDKLGAVYKVDYRP